MFPDEAIIIVSGLPRSGTSMMMQMLQAGGISLAYDNIRPADVHNPYGYFELEKAKKLEQDNAWISKCKGKAIKILFHLLKYLPESLNYKVIFIYRELNDILNSQEKMLRSYGKPQQNRGKIYQIFEEELYVKTEWIKKQKNMDVLFLDFEEILNNPEENARKIEDFLARKMDIQKISAMVKV